MQKTFCDICNKEIEAKELRGGFLRHKEVFPMGQGVQFGPKGESNLGQSQVQPEICELCEKCTEETATFLENLNRKKIEAGATKVVQAEIKT